MGHIKLEKFSLEVVFSLKEHILLDLYLYWVILIWNRNPIEIYYVGNGIVWKILFWKNDSCWNCTILNNILSESYSLLNLFSWKIFHWKCRYIIAADYGIWFRPIRFWANTTNKFKSSLIFANGLTSKHVRFRVNTFSSKYRLNLYSSRW